MTIQMTLHKKKDIDKLHMQEMTLENDSQDLRMV